MKKTLFGFLFTVSAFSAYTQGNIYKGSVMIGGNASFSAEKQGSFKATTLGLAPDAGYFFMNNLAGGLRVGFSSRNSDFGSTETTTSEFSLAPFLRYYFLPAEQKVNIFADASFGFGQSKSETGSAEVKNNFTQFGIQAGPAIFLTPNTALEFALGYFSSKYEGVEDRENNFGLNIGFQIHLAGVKKK